MSLDETTGFAAAAMAAFSLPGPRIPNSPTDSAPATVAHASIAGMDAVLDPTGALYWASQSTLVVSDLHLETGSSYARTGQMLPPYDTARTLQRMSAAVARHCPSRIISLGDSFHDPGGAQRLNEADKAVISSLAASAEFVWVTGNHDGDSAAALGGTACEHIEVEGVVFRHIPTEGTVQGCEVAGHLHPAAYVSIKGRTIRRRCFIGTDQRMIMPAFGCLTGGLSVTDSAFAGLWPSAPRLHLIGSNRVYSL